MRVLHLVNASLLLSMGKALNIFERQTDVCKWSLAPDDCICMNSMNGSISMYHAANYLLIKLYPPPTIFTINILISCVIFTSSTCANMFI